MNSGRHLGRFRHSGHAHGTDQPTVIEQVGLDYIADPIGDRPPETPFAIFLFTLRDRNIEGIANLLAIAERVELARLLVVDLPVFFEHAAYGNSVFRII